MDERQSCPMKRSVSSPNKLPSLSCPMKRNSSSPDKRSTVYMLSNEDVNNEDYVKEIIKEPGIILVEDATLYKHSEGSVKKVPGKMISRWYFQ